MEKILNLYSIPEFWLTKSQGKKDNEIIKGYRKIINYFLDHPDMAINPYEREILKNWYMHDVVLRSDENLHRNLWRVLLKTEGVDTKLIHAAKEFYKLKN